MDRALKERIIGVIVLVVFAVIIVPVFLDGPPQDTETVSATLQLPGQNGEVPKQQTIVLDRNRDEPVPTASNAATAQQVTPPAQLQERANASAAAGTSADPPQQPKAQPAADTASAAASDTGLWAVQLGSFSNQQNAERLAADLRKQGYAAFLSQVRSGDGSLHRVRVGPQKDRASADAVAARLKSAGHSSQVVPHP